MPAWRESLGSKSLTFLASVSNSPVVTYGGLQTIRSKSVASRPLMMGSKRSPHSSWTRSVRLCNSRFWAATAKAESLMSVAIIFALWKFFAIAMAMQPEPVHKSRTCCGPGRVRRNSMARSASSSVSGRGMRQSPETFICKE